MYLYIFIYFAATAAGSLFVIFNARSVTGSSYASTGSSCFQRPVRYWCSNAATATGSIFDTFQHPARNWVFLRHHWLFLLPTPSP